MTQTGSIGASNQLQQTCLTLNTYYAFESEQLDILTSQSYRAGKRNV
jgi:hypothetical protein